MEREQFCDESDIEGPSPQEMAKVYRKIDKAPFTADQFTPTKWDTAADKAKFANQFVKFVSGGFKRTDFPKWFYNRLSGTFGHIAHYDIHGFYSEFFIRPDGHVRFVAVCLSYGAFGSPDYTYCDVERALKGWLRDGAYLEKLAKVQDDAIEAKEREQLARLKAKYE